MRRMPVALLLAVLAGTLTFTPPAGWKSSNPTSSMRVAEFTLPRAAGDADDAHLVVYYFGGSGGSVDANIQRWIGQMQQPDGKAPSAAATRETRKVHGLTVTLVDVSGTYVAEMSPGAAEHHNQARYRLRAGVVETTNGPYFVKLVGPEKTIARWDAAFNQFVESFEFK